MKNRIALFRQISVATIIFLAVTPLPSYASKERAFNAVSYQYNVRGSPQVTYRKFKSRISITDRGIVKVIEIKNYISRKSTPDARVTIAISGSDVGSAVYNDKNELLADFGKGIKINNNLYTFSHKDGEKTVSALWFVDDDSIMSDYTISDKDNNLLFKETVIYSAKTPLRKKR